MSKPDISKVKVWDKVYGRWEKRAYTVMARNDRFIIIAKPFNPRKTFQYSIIDLVRGFMWPDNYIFGKYDYLNVSDCNEAIEELQKNAWNTLGMDISERKCVPIIKFDKIVHID